MAMSACFIYHSNHYRAQLSTVVRQRWTEKQTKEIADHYGNQRLSGLSSTGPFMAMPLGPVRLPLSKVTIHPVTSISDKRAERKFVVLHFIFWPFLLIKLHVRFESSKKLSLQKGLKRMWYQSQTIVLKDNRSVYSVYVGFKQTFEWLNSSLTGWDQITFRRLLCWVVFKISAQKFRMRFELGSNLNVTKSSLRSLVVAPN